MTWVEGVEAGIGLMDRSPVWLDAGQAEENSPSEFGCKTGSSTGGRDLNSKEKALDFMENSR